MRVAYPHPTFAMAAKATKLRYPPHQGEGDEGTEASERELPPPCGEG